MTNKEKFDEHKEIIDECNKNGLLGVKPSVYEMENLKYSDNPLLRKACAIIAYADKLYIDTILMRIV